MESGDSFSKALDTITNLLIDIAEDGYDISNKSKTLANEVLKLLNKKGMKITEWLLEILRALLRSEKYPFIEQACTEVKDIVKKPLILSVENLLDLLWIW